ncbi:MAG: hypothetical protein R3223_06760 [Longimicrobiales bacterium]|nr:hypothetical protein [Longimicrobiales bacterium]
MWKFEDDEGRRWEIVVGRESWGGFFALFVPAGDGGEIRQTAIDADSQTEASRRIEELGRTGWLRLLKESRPKELG